MIISKTKLKKIIREAFIGQVGKPPVHTQSYMKNPPLPDEYESMRTAVNKKLQSGDLETKRQALNLVGTISGDDMAHTISDASLKDETFIKDDKPLDRDASRIQTVLNRVQSDLQKNETISSLLDIEYLGDLEDYEVVLNREVISKIYGLIGLGRDTDAKNVAMNYLDTTFISDNPEISNAVSQLVKDWGASSFSDLYMNQRIYSRNVSGDLEISVYGILSSDFSPRSYKNVGVNINFNDKPLIKDLERNFENNSDAKKFAFTIARMTGALSMPAGAHMANYYFKTLGTGKGFTCEITCD